VQWLADDGNWQLYCGVYLVDSKSFPLACVGVGSPGGTSHMSMTVRYKSRLEVGVCRWQRVCVPALFVAILFPPAIYENCIGQTPTEYQIKAAFLFNFLKFVEWPGDPAMDPQAKWVIGIVGDSPVSTQLSYLFAGKNVMGRDVQVKQFQAADNLRVCNILFIGTSEKKRLPSILSSLHGFSVLTVADMDHFIESGGMVQFVEEDSHVRVAIDVGTTSRAHLKVSSKLLALARTVTSAEGSPNN